MSGLSLVGGWLIFVVVVCPGGCPRALSRCGREAKADRFRTAVLDLATAAATRPDDHLDRRYRALAVAGF
ncbi:MAG: hypothetical protein ABW022_14595, partial [Actinoplanes sp.]